MKSKEKIRGAKAWAVFIPTIILILILLMAFVVVTVFINKRSEKDANDAHKATECISLVNSLQSRSSSMAETLSSFIYNPALPVEPIEIITVEIPPGSGNMVTGPKWTYNTTPLDTYYDSLSNDETDPDYVFDIVIEQIKQNNFLINDASERTVVMKDLADIVEIMNTMSEVQKHAVYVTTKITDKPGFEVPQKLLDELGSYTFTDTDIERTSSGKASDIIDYALEIIFEKTYAMNKKVLSSKINNVTSTLRAESANIESESDKIVWNLRRTLWGLSALIILALAAFFFTMFKLVINPIARYTKGIQNNEMLDDEVGVYEVNYLARSYNELLDKKSDFEYRLKAVAETDPLTGFANRYSYNKFLASKTDLEHSTCIFMLDINNLKFVNDTYGHDKGDELIKNSSLAIKETFMDMNGKNCYRLGGDEFIAIMDNIKEEEIEEYLKKFRQKQMYYAVSIAIGYAYTSDISKEGYENLMIEADKRMYENKKEMKKANGLAS